MVPGGFNNVSLTTPNFVLYNVLKLLDNGSNWLTYCKCVLSAIGSQELKCHLEGHAKKPPQTTIINAGDTTASRQSLKAEPLSDSWTVGCHLVNDI